MRSNYIEILKNRVEIPIIQRDYAQGRTDTKTNKIRKDFLDTIFEFILRKNEDSTLELDLDFIYGLNREAETFIPIDGQQRLTTLWLLYWFIATKENVPNEEKSFLKSFIYETRHSTTQFCKKLVEFKADFLHDSISTEIKNQSWYFDTWNYDPGIQAMLVVLIDIEKRYSELKFDLWNLLGNRVCPFFFYKLDMEKVGLTDDLYIKMNSRGKPLTEFEYFKAGFTELLTEPRHREKFESSIDGIWMETIWQVVFEFYSDSDDYDVALAVDQAFLNLFNFITSVLSFKNEIKTTNNSYYIDTEYTPELLREIYGDMLSVNYLFDTLDSICTEQPNDHVFWDTLFYYDKGGFDESNTRLYFQHGETNLLKRCLYHFDRQRRLSYPEQLLLTACLAHFRSPQEQLTGRIRVIRNLATNSDSELRESILGKSFEEVEQYMLKGDLNVFKSFKRDQIEEEKHKSTYLKNLDKSVLRQLEDSDLLRGCIALIPLDSNFRHRASLFLKLFDEDEMISAYEERCNLLLCFGDYSQADGTLKNLLSRSKSEIRKFFTTPGYTKNDFFERTQKIVTTCLDFFIENTAIQPQQKIDQTLKEFIGFPKDWRYYFLKYPSFREHCQYGYYVFVSGFPEWKMGKKQFNGYHWNPFLHEVFINDESGAVVLKNYGMYDQLEITSKEIKVQVSNLSNGKGFHFLAISQDSVLNNLVQKGYIDGDHNLIIDQDHFFLDLEDRVEKLKTVINQITN